MEPDARRVSVVDAHRVTAGAWYAETHKPMTEPH